MLNVLCSCLCPVGATNKNDSVAPYSNSAPFLTLLAPGSSITSSIPAGLFASWDGTSMAAPHVAGAWAILKQRAPRASVDEIQALRSTGVPVTDWRNGVTTPRIEVATALRALAPTTTTTSTTTSTTRPESCLVDCGHGTCCPATYPVCGSDGRCYRAGAF